MKFLSTSKVIDYKIVDLPRQSWSYMPPKKWQIALTIAGIILTAIVWSLF